MLLLIRYQYKKESLKKYHINLIFYIYDNNDKQFFNILKIILLNKNNELYQNKGTKQFKINI